MTKVRSTGGPAASAEDLARRAGRIALEKKGEDVVILDLRGAQIGCDFFVIVSGNSDSHVRAIGDAICECITKETGSGPWHVEGMAYGHWVLLDFVDWVVHVFHRETRAYYMLERLWGDVPHEVLEDSGPLTERCDA